MGDDRPQVAVDLVARVMARRVLWAAIYGDPGDDLMPIVRQLGREERDAVEARMIELAPDLAPTEEFLAAYEYLAQRKD